MLRKRDLRAPGGQDTRWVVDAVPILTTGKAALQDCLNKGEQQGWELVTICPAGTSNFVLVTWDRAGQNA